MGQYDPLGMLSPLLLKVKLMMRELYGASYTGSWDDPLPPAHQEKWVSFITSALQIEAFRVPRSVVQVRCSGLWLIAFWDGSLEAHASCIYSRTEAMEEDGGTAVKTALLFAKSRVAPMSGMTISKMEVQGLVQCSRSLLKVVLVLDTPVERVVMAGDSMCALMSLRRQGVAFKLFFQNRVAEAVNNLQQVEERVGILEETLKVATELNPADICTRGKAQPGDGTADSIWQRGPEFLRLPRELWPLTIPDDPGAVPEEEMRRGVLIGALEGEGAVYGLGNLLDKVLGSAKTLERAKGTLARVLKAKGTAGNSADHIRLTPTPDYLEASWVIMLRHEQAQVREMHGLETETETFNVPNIIKLNIDL